MALHLAARIGNVNIVNLLLNISPNMIMQTNNVSKQIVQFIVVYLIDKQYLKLCIITNKWGRCRGKAGYGLPVKYIRAHFIHMYVVNRILLKNTLWFVIHPKYKLAPYFIIACMCDMT